MTQNRHAVVIGGSMAGLLAARVLSERFDRVTIVERDEFPAGSEHRRGVPQARHTHGLLANGANILEDLLPGLRRELVQCGAVEGDIVHRGRWFHEGGCARQFPSGLNGIALSRPLLEGVVRRRVLGLANVDTIDGREAVALTATADRRRVTGVRLADGATLAAHLVVNATGRGSHAARWLRDLGYDDPPMDRVEVALGYTTRVFRRNPAELGGDIVVVVPPTPEGRRSGVLLAQEGDRWTATLVSYFGNYAPLDIEGFRAFARTLPCPDIYNVIRTAEPIGPAQSARFPASVRLRYERLTRFPEGYLVSGDAICSFNPIYGQGMTVAAMEALALGRALDNGSRPLAQAFFEQVAPVIDIPWSMVTGGDLRIPETVGHRTAGVRFINWYLSKLHRAAHHDAEVSLAFHRVANLLEPPPSILRPRIAWRVLKGNLRGDPLYIAKHPVVDCDHGPGPGLHARACDRQHPLHP